MGKAFWGFGWERPFGGLGFVFLWVWFCVLNAGGREIRQWPGVPAKRSKSKERERGQRRRGKRDA